jgi:hypothetical protein
MGSTVTDWVAGKISSEDGVEVVGRTSEDFLIVRPHDGSSFPLAVIGVKDVIQREHIEPIISGENKPMFVVNVPSKALWSGTAISLVHAAPAAFGTLGELSKAARLEVVSEYRNKTREFFYRAIRQHSNVYQVSLVYEAVVEAHRVRNGNLIIALVDAYNMSAEDVRNARDRFGTFDIAVKTSSYGSVTSEAEEAAASFGAEALTFKGLMQRLSR